VLLAAWLFGTGLWGCSNSQTGIAPACIDGTTQSCACIDGGKGAQACEGGKFTPCVCAGSSDAVVGPGDVAELKDEASAVEVVSADTSGPGPADGTTSGADGANPEVSSDTGSSGTCPGGPGCACAENLDCQNGLCIDDPNVTEGKACARSCIDNCPDGYTCAQVSPTGGDVVSICVAKYGHLCEPCGISKDCASLGLKDSQCVDQGVLGRFCGIGCATDAGCPADYTCQDVTTVEGGKLKQCVRKPDDKQSPFGVCPCSSAAVQKKLATACFVEAKDASGKVVGKCAGQRVCGSNGLSACAAPEATAEVCDGADNDCDGQTDEATCDDGKPCTKDVCDGKAGCKSQPLDGDPCDADGSVCTENDTCKAGVCTPGAKKDCDDKNPCTSDSCDLAKGCTQVADDGKPCDADGSACTAGDVCQGGACQKGQAVLCDDGNPCTTDKCDPKTGQCATLPMKDGVPCDDGTKCTNQDACDQGVCLGVAVNCNDNNPCTDDVCDKQKGCSPAVLTGSPCSDDNPCTIGDTCDAGSCKSGSPKVCSAPNVCVSATCDVTKNGACTFENLDPGTPCDDGSACTDKDGCSSGKCKGSTVNCDDGNPCTNDVCDPKFGCVTTPNTAPCDADGNACTSGDACKDKVCVPGVKKVCDDGEPCTSDSCDAKTGFCVFDGGLLAGKPCNADSSVCTENDQCMSGKCIVGKSKVCEDGNACTNDDCDAKTGCTITLNASTCNDGSACTTADKCADGKCSGKPLDPKVDCNDGNGCTTDACDPTQGCTYTPNQASCDDGNACTQGDQCTAGKCVSGTGVCACQSDGDCAKLDDKDLCNGVLYCDKSVAGQFACKTKPGSVVICDVNANTACTQQVCDPSIGQCAAKPLVDGKLCDADGSVCSNGDACAGGTCVAGAAVDCNDKNPCTTDSCDPKAGCVNQANTAPCDADGNACTVGDTCQSKACVAGTKKTCDDGNPCSSDGCDAKTGACVFDAAAQQGKPCDADASVCTLGDACANGACKVGATVDCDDKNPCTNDGCDAKLGCTHVANTATCDADGNACTVGDSCQNSTCVAGTKKNCNDGELCTTDSCAALTGQCLFDATPSQGALCDDGNLCTEGDACGAGKCVAGKMKVCNDNNPCTDDSCDSQKGCVYTANTAPCDDGSACTKPDMCAGGVCAGKPINVGIDCNDNQVCTTDACDPKVGCTHTANQLGCDDGNPCTQGDLCANKACTSGSDMCGCTKDTDCIDDGDLCNGTLFCDTGKVPYACKVKPASVVTCDTSKDSACAAASCDAKTGQCALVPAVNGKTCDADGSVCTNGDACASGLCKPGTQVDCNDNNPCTDDSCNAKLGCVQVANTLPCDADGSVCTAGDACKDKLCTAGAKLVCNDGNACTDDTCDKVAGCQSTNNTAPCDDGTVCTSNDVCTAGQCVGKVTNCDDGNACTSDSCDKVKGCTFVAAGDGNLCSDGTVCTTDDTCAAGKCVGQPLNCNDGNTCTTDSCDKTAGCQSLNNTAACDDGSACTSNDLCGAGKCAGSVVTCNDGNTCTTDSCDPASGCKYVNNTAACDDGSVCTTNDTCSGGVCTGAAKPCDDSNVCTTDTCDKVAGCQFTNNTSGCNDGNACTGSDLCGAGKCAGAAVNCSDGEACTADSCDPLVGCSNLALSDDTPCDDGSACTGPDVCKTGKCGGGAKSCDDGNPCTTDGCDVLKGCTTVTVKDGNACDDNNVCTANDACTSGKCTGAGKTCDDNNACTDNNCDPVTGACTYPNNTAPCDDGLICTTGDACTAGTCKGGGNKCDDKNPCTADTCASSNGACSYKAQLGSCSDNNACTNQDTCGTDANGNGVCLPGAAVTCNDNNVCTDDTCAPATGCVYTNNTFSQTCYDGPTGSAGKGLCKSGTKTCSKGTAGACVGQVLPTTEVCGDNIDQDCDGSDKVCAGEFIWAQRFGDDYTVQLNGLAIDRAPNEGVNGQDYLYGTGAFVGTTSPGERLTSASANETDIWLTRWNFGNGHYWSRRFGDDKSQAGLDVSASDANGDVVMGGRFAGVVNFGAGTVATTSVAFPASITEGRVITLVDAKGTTKTFEADLANNGLVTPGAVGFGAGAGGSAANIATGFCNALNSLGLAGPEISCSVNTATVSLSQRNPGAAGNTAVTSNLDNGAGALVAINHFAGGGGVLASAGGNDAFVVRFNSGAGYKWQWTLGDAGDDLVQSVQIGPNEETYVLGVFSGTVTVGSTKLVSAGKRDLFLARLDNAANVVWIKAYGGPGDEVAGGVAVDANGFVYAAASFEDTVDFGAGAAVSAGLHDVVLLRVAAATGVFTAAKTYGGAGDDLARNIASTSVGQVRVVGTSNGDLSLGGGSLAGLGGVDTWVASWKQLTSSSFSPMWSKRFGDAGDQIATDLALYDDGSVTLTGTYDTEFSVTVGANPVKLTPADKTDAFALRLDLTGAPVWAKSGGGTGDQIGRTVALGQAGEPYLGGDFNGQMNWSGNGVMSQLYNRAGFVLRLDATTGNEAWRRHIIDTDDQRIHDTAVAPDDSVVAVGAFRGTVNLGGGRITNRNPYLTTATHQTVWDGYVVKYDANGKFLWHKVLQPVAGIGGERIPRAVDIDLDGNIFIGGHLTGEVDGGLGRLAPPNGNKDGFVAKYDPAGKLLWLKIYGDGGEQEVNDLAVDELGNVWLVGSFYGNLNFGPTSTTNLASNSNSWDMFVARLDTDGGLLWSNKYGDGDHQYMYTISFDPFGNALVGGSFRGCVAPGDGNNYCWDGVGMDSVILKLKPNGSSDWSRGWVRSVGRNEPGGCNGWEQSDFVSGVTGNIFGTWNVAISMGNNQWSGCGWCGPCWGSLDLGVGGVAANPNDDQNVVMAQFASSGTTKFSVGYPGGGYQVVRGITSDSAGNTLMLSQITANYTIGSAFAAQGNDLVMTKYDASNKIVWSKIFTGGSTEWLDFWSSGIATDSANNVVVIGNFDSANLELNGPAKLATAGKADSFLTKRSP
jgi:hypothetical protein